MVLPSFVLLSVNVMRDPTAWLLSKFRMHSNISVDFMEQPKNLVCKIVLDIMYTATSSVVTVKRIPNLHSCSWEHSVTAGSLVNPSWMVQHGLAQTVGFAVSTVDTSLAKVSVKYSSILLNTNCLQVLLSIHLPDYIGKLEINRHMKKLG